MAGVSIRYARAFADVIADKRLDADATLGELSQVVGLVNESAELRTVLESPAIPAEQKHKLIEAIAQRAGFSTPVRNFLAVIVDHRRVALLGEIAQQVRAELNQRLGIADAEVTSARELGDDERRELESRLIASTGRKVRAHYQVDPTVLGGAVVRIGSTIYDGSVRGQLRKLKEELSS